MGFQHLVFFEQYLQFFKLFSVRGSEYSGGRNKKPSAFHKQILINELYLGSRKEYFSRNFQRFFLLILGEKLTIALPGIIGLFASSSVAFNYVGSSLLVPHERYPPGIKISGLRFDCYFDSLPEGYRHHAVVIMNQSL